MGTQDQTPNSRTQSGTRQPTDDRQKQRAREAKDKDAGNVPQSDDDVADEATQGSREDAAGPRGGNA